MPDNFDREVDEWFEKLEAQLAPVGRITPAGPEDEGQTGPVRPVLSHPFTLAPRRPVRRDVDQIKAIIAKPRRLAEAKRRRRVSPGTRRRIHPRG